jgi:hypothetical protein
MSENEMRQCSWKLQLYFEINSSHKRNWLVQVLDEEILYGELYKGLEIPADALVCRCLGRNALCTILKSRRQITRDISSKRWNMTGMLGLM